MIELAKGFFMTEFMKEFVPGGLGMQIDRRFTCCGNRVHHVLEFVKGNLDSFIFKKLDDQGHILFGDYLPSQSSRRKEGFDGLGTQEQSRRLHDPARTETR